MNPSGGRIFRRKTEGAAQRWARAPRWRRTHVGSAIAAPVFVGPLDDGGGNPEPVAAPPPKAVRAGRRPVSRHFPAPISRFLWARDSRREHLVLGIGVIGLAVFASGAPALAQVPDIHMHAPGLFTGSFLAVDRARPARPWQPSAKFFSTFALKPLRVDLKSPHCLQGCTTDAVDWALAVHFQAQMGLGSRLELAFDLPLMRHSLSDPALALLKELQPISNIAPPETSPLDARVGLRLKLFNHKYFALALALTGTIPFGNEEVFASDGLPTLQPQLLASGRHGNLELAVAAGYRFRPRRLLWDQDPAQHPSDARLLLGIDDELTFGVALTYTLFKQLELGAELIGSTMLGSDQQSLTSTTLVLPPNPGCPADTPAGLPCELSSTHTASFPATTVVELLGGLRWRISDGLSLIVGGGAGLAGGPRQVALRGMVGLSWQAATKGSSDRDGDGIPDDKDECPDQPEDFDGQDDADGCPDLDSDGDGIPDDKDRCPHEPEDLDGYQDEDGCPDPDNDGDGIPDRLDQCPNAPEDKDGVDDHDGCPDPDNDGDGIPDSKDRCPLEPETKNGYLDDDGCPDRVPPLARQSGRGPRGELPC